ncbi:TerC family protein [Thermomonas carbonis]|uniref:TerC family protein n=1 Tax=Thermomonas carbonis TaxID=1463158 RepID=A0A7G9ST32_9GAMM|nr:TerC family protein [Thermomonas carbonis]QNN71007.1 TerC family protein [Thermomonas carbonis]GHC03875.1 membrane protein [Thermomonas carbonis]
MESIGTPFLWLMFAGVVVVALLVDLVLMRHGGPHKVTFKEATWWSIGWVVLALAFNAWLWWYSGQQFGAAEGERIGMEFLTGYLVEKSLAVDNIFVFLMIFTYFSVPEEQKQRVLVIGIIAAIVLRAILIFAGAFLLAKFHWILYVFGAFLLLTGIKMIMAAGKAPDLEQNPLLRWLTAHVPMTRSYHGSALSVLEGGKKLYTPLFIVIVMIGITDVIFAVDSIPAIFAITDDPFIVLTSNVFAVLGLRAMFFLLQGMADRFHLLPYGLAMVLMFIGAKMLLVDIYKIPIGISLGVVATTIAATIALSLLRPPPPAR